MPLTLSQLAPILSNPALFYGGLAAVSIPIIIHLLTRIRRRPQQWGAMKFLLEAYRKHRRRLRLEQWLLLLVRCLILFVLGAALAGPMLSGCTDALGLDPGGKVVYLIIDDGLSQRASADGQGEAARFERQRKLALRVIDTFAATDQVGLVLTARPAEPLMLPPQLDRAAVRRRVERLSPRHARSDLSAALKLVQASLADRKPPADRTYVILLSDFCRGSADLDEAISDQAARLDQAARVLVSRPMPSVANTQIASIQLRRHMLLTGDLTSEGPARIGYEITLRRIADPQAARVSKVELELIGDDPGKPLAAAPPQEVRWTADTTKVSLRSELIVPPEVLDALNLGGAGGSSTGTGGSGAPLVLRARIEPDALVEDNERFATVELRRRLRVGIIGDGEAAGDGAARFRPARWLSLALSPRADGSAFDVSQMTAIELDDRRAQTLDAALVIRPDQLGDSGWKSLRSLVDRGGIVWVFAPAMPAPATWAEMMRTRLGVPWQVGIDAETLGTQATPAARDAPAPPANTADIATTGVGLSLDKLEPEALSMLAAEWKDLLRPIRVFKRLPLSQTAGGDQVWLAAQDGKPLLVMSGVGDGAVFLLGCAVDDRWTNLVTKPLFLPLLHESLRSVKARTAEASRLSDIVSGDRPALSKVWEGTAQLRRLGTGASSTPAGSAPGADILLRRIDDGFEPATPLDVPGIYQALPDAQGRLIPVNIDADAGDTEAVDIKALEAWLKSLGDTRWLDDDNVAAAFAAFESRLHIGLPLLWTVLALVLLEVLLARWFSHAHAGKPHVMLGAGAMLFRRFVGRTPPQK